MNGPPEIWLDPRVVRSMKTEPDLDSPEGLESLLYISQERVREITRAASGDEFFIQILLDDRELMGLTNYGRIFRHQPDSLAWMEIAPPELAP